jgi:hypothetical protein
VSACCTPDGGAFQLSKGIGVAVVVGIPPGPQWLFRAQRAVRLEVELAFTPRPRNDDVQV